jgi:hypothetical protein
MIGYKLLDLGLISCHLSTGPTYTKEISGTTDGTWRWEAGIGGNILGFITTDIRYTFKNSNESGTEQMENLVSNGGMVNLTDQVKKLWGVDKNISFAKKTNADKWI